MSNNPTRIKQVFFIDSAVPDSDVIVAGLATDAVYYRLDANQDGLQQMADSLAGYSGLDAIQIISHGSPGGLQLSNGLVTQATLDDHSVALSSIGSALSETGDLLLYGCDVAQGDVGQAFIQRLAAADVAIAASAQQNYNHVLGVSDYQLAQMSNLAYSDNPSFDGWNATPHTDPSSDGFFAVEFQKDNDIVIAFRGTDFWSVSDDYSADKAIAGLLPWQAQFTAAIELANEIRSANSGKHIYVTGHSLGGALAQVVSQLFGFSGATFDPGGAQNLISSDEFRQIATEKVDNPDGVGVPTDFINYIVNGSAISGDSGDHVGSSVLLENEPIQNFFQLAEVRDPSPILELLRIYLLHSMDGIERLMQAIVNNDETTFLQQEATTAVTTGDIGVSNQTPDQGSIDFSGTDDNNYLYTNNRDNAIYGYAGNDIIYSFAGNDTVYAGDGDDTISTAQGDDVIDAGSGDDTVSAGSGDDTIEVNATSGWDSIDGGAGTDLLSVVFSGMTSYYIWSSPLYTVGAGSDLNQIQSMLADAASTATMMLYINPYDYTVFTRADLHNIEHYDITATDYDDLLIYLGGIRYLGGNGTDTFYADWSSTPTLITWNNLPNTTQTVNGSTVSGLERLLLTTGSGNDKLSNTTVSTDDTFITGAGNDTLNGGAGNDVLTGGTGNDTYVVDTTNDVITELKSEGIDTVNSPISWTLQANLENLTLLGMTAINATGNTLNNVLTGNAAANTLNGGTGADKMTGGLGNDIYIVDKVGDKVIESSTLATEIDSINSSVSYILAANVENLTLTGTAALNGTGNSSANTLTGNTANNLLLGNAANDTLSGGAGNDKLDGGTGNDVLTGGADLDLFRFTTAPTANRDTITDFSVADDTIQLENAVFKKLATPGVLKAANFVKAGAAHDLNDYLVYNPATGTLSYDADGNGTGVAVQIALLGVNLALTNADFVII